MRELTYEEVGELSGGNPITIGLGLGFTVGGVMAGLDYALNSSSFSALGLSLNVTQGAMVGVLTTGGTMLLGVPGGAAAGIPALGLAAIVETTDPLASLAD